MNWKSYIEGWKRSICSGLLWLLIVFVIDCLNSIALLESSTKHIKSKTDPEIKEILIDAVVMYTFQIFVGYMIIGVLAGILVHIFTKLWFTTEPTRTQWWLSWFGFGITVSGICYFRNLISAPCLHGWLGHDMRQKLSDGLDFWMVDSVAVAVVITLMAFIWRRWTGHD